MVLEVRDLIWLLLPLAAASGWYAARLDQRRSPARLSPDYFRGINYLLNEQPDKAIEVFTRMLEVNAETVETHLALGSLFRRRGEVERAIRIHQNLIARPMLEAAQRTEALSELAQDYLKAGLLDRAENLFLELSEIPLHAEQTLQALMAIYEQEKDWDKAIATGQRLTRMAGHNLGPVLAQYHCELGELARQAGDVDRARTSLLRALSADPKCVRANVLLGQIAAAHGDERAAIAAWQSVERQDPQFLDEVIGDIAAAFRRVSDEPQLRVYLQEVAARQPGMRTLLILAELIGAHDGHAAALAVIGDHLHRQPSVAGLKRLMDLQVKQTSPDLMEHLNPIKGILDRLATQQEGYQCRQCGFRGQVLHWQCPACHGWNTVQACAFVPATAAIADQLPSRRPLISFSSDNGGYAGRYS